MSVFSDLKTPAAKRPEPPLKPLGKLTIKPHSTLQQDKRSPLIPWIQGVLDAPTSTVNVCVEAKTVFSDGTAGDGVQVTFFLDGHRLRDVKTDDFGLALLNEPISAKLFTMNFATDELVARVKGFPQEASVRVQVRRKQLRLTVLHRWENLSLCPITSGCGAPTLECARNSRRQSL